MPEIDRIYLLRKETDARRQPGSLPRLVPLWKTIENHGFDGPYQLTQEQLDSLLARREFIACGLGLAGRSSATYLYRLTSVPALVRSVSTWTARIRSEAPNQSVVRLFDRDHRKNRGWLSLAAYSSGQLRGFRGISWWTSCDVSEPEVMQNAYRCGMPNEWIPVNGIILRCQVDKIDVRDPLRIPDGVDAFFSEIFHTVQENGGSLAGQAIDVTNPDDLTAGEEEFVMGPIPVEAVEFRPVDLHDRDKYKVTLDGIRPTLEAYYQALGGR